MIETTTHPTIYISFSKFVVGADDQLWLLTNTPEGPYGTYITGFAVQSRDPATGWSKPFTFLAPKTEGLGFDVHPDGTQVILYYHNTYMSGVDEELLATVYH